VHLIICASSLKELEKEVFVSVNHSSRCLVCDCSFQRMLQSTKFYTCKRRWKHLTSVGFTNEESMYYLRFLQNYLLCANLSTLSSDTTNQLKELLKQTTIRFRINALCFCTGLCLSRSSTRKLQLGSNDKYDPPICSIVLSKEKLLHNLM